MGEDRLRELLELGKCEKCKRGDFSECCSTKEEANASIEKPKTEEVKYFCAAACALLYVMDSFPPEELKHLIESQFNREGHYEKLASFWRDRDGRN